MELNNVQLNGSYPKIDSDILSLMEEFSFMAAKWDIEVKPFHTAAEWQKFTQLNHVHKDAIHNRLLSYVEVCDTTIKEGYELSDPLNLTWNMLKKLQIHPCRDTFNYLAQTDVIEIYDTNSIQLFRNLQFFKICSYSLTELFSYELWELYRRSPEITSTLISKVTEIFNGKILTSTAAGVPDHVVEEIFSPKRNKYLIRQKNISPLFNKQNQPNAVLGNFKILKS